MLKKTRNPLITTTITLLLVGASFLVFGILGGITGESQFSNLMLIPFISGYLHSGIEHLLYNIIMLFLCLHSALNINLDFKNIYWITFFISLLYLPVSLLGITQPAIGISGTCYFLMTRALLSWERKNLGAIILVSFLLFELSETIGSEDQIAYGVHYIGVFLGYVSLRNCELIDKITNYKIMLTLFGLKPQSAN